MTSVDTSDNFCGHIFVSRSSSNMHAAVFTRSSERCWVIVTAALDRCLTARTVSILICTWVPVPERYTRGKTTHHYARLVGGFCGIMNNSHTAMSKQCTARQNGSVLTLWVRAVSFHSLGKHSTNANLVWLAWFLNPALLARLRTHLLSGCRACSRATFLFTGTASTKLLCLRQHHIHIGKTRRADGRAEWSMRDFSPFRGTETEPCRRICMRSRVH